jgi:DNA-binding transcriptional ArsR family regulator
MKTQVDGLIILGDEDPEKEYLDKYFKGGEIKIKTENPLKAGEIILNAIRGAKKHGKVFVAYGEDGLGALLGFMANKEEVDAIYLCYAEKALRLPSMKLDITKTRHKILDVLSKKNLSAIEIAENVQISRAMVYKHLNVLIELGLVKTSDLFGKYSITITGQLIML